jgi:sarcosine oxidase, subunit beta
LLPIAEHRAPKLMAGKKVTGRAGYYGVTPDRHPALGRLEDIIVAAGFGGHGVMHSPAAGLVVSEMVLSGESKTLNVEALTPTRFKSGRLLAESWVF